MSGLSMILKGALGGLRASESFKMGGRCRMTLFDHDGREVGCMVTDNLITDTGLREILDKLGEEASGNAEDGPQYVWVGSGSTPATNADTSLDSFESEKQFSSFVRAAGGLTGSWSVTFGTDEGNHEWEEVALADDVNGTGNMWTRAVFTSQLFTKISTQTLVVEYELTISRS